MIREARPCRSRDIAPPRLACGPVCFPRVSGFGVGFGVPHAWLIWLRSRSPHTCGLPMWSCGMDLGDHRLGCLPVELVRRVEGEAVDDVAEASTNLCAHLLGLADNSESVQHGVVDESGHRVPGIDFGQPVQFGVEIAPAVQVEHAPICRSRAIERDYAAYGSRGLR